MSVNDFDQFTKFLANAPPPPQPNKFGIRMENDDSADESEDDPANKPKADSANEPDENENAL